MSRRFGSPLILVGVGASLACLLLLLWQTNLESCWRTLSQVEPVPLSVALLFCVLGFAAKCFRWRSFFPPGNVPRFSACWRAFVGGNFINNLVPGRGGDLVRCLAIGRKHSSGGTAAVVATLLLEKIFDGLTLATLLLLTVVLISPPDWVVGVAGTAGVLFLGLLSLLIALNCWPNWFIASWEKLARFLRMPQLGAYIRSTLERFSLGLATIRSARPFVMGLLLTAAIWLIDIQGTWWMASSLGIPLSLVGATVLSAVVGLGFMIPAAPGNVGTYEASAIAGLSLFGIGFDQAIPLAVLMHGSSLILTSVLGLTGLRLMRQQPLSAIEDRDSASLKHSDHVV